MKIFEYKFYNISQELSCEIGRRVESFLTRCGDTDLSSLPNHSLGENEDARVRINVASVSNILEKSLISSTQSIIDYSEYISIKSNLTCRFAVVEFDAVLRICFSNNDDIIDFSDVGVIGIDISNLITETDLFDFI